MANPFFLALSVAASLVGGPQAPVSHPDQIVVKAAVFEREGGDQGSEVNSVQVCNGISEFFSLLDSEGAVKLIMRPTIYTLPGHEAKLQVSDNKGSGDARFDDTLAVTPKLASDGSISMDVTYVANSYIKTASNMPAVNVLTTSTTCSVRVGQTVVLKGKHQIIVITPSIVKD